MVYGELFLQHRLVIEIVYTALIVLLTAYLTFQINNLYRVSDHTGLRYFRNTFFFFGLAFFIRYFMHYLPEPYLFPLFVLFSTVIGLSGFSLLHSMLWKEYPKVWVLYPIALIVPLWISFSQTSSLSI
jgi:hypothetical protein